jgi:hypothetical protein
MADHSSAPCLTIQINYAVTTMHKTQLFVLVLQSARVFKAKLLMKILDFNLSPLKKFLLMKILDLNLRPLKNFIS